MAMSASYFLFRYFFYDTISNIDVDANIKDRQATLAGLLCFVSVQHQAMIPPSAHPASSYL